MAIETLPSLDIFESLPFPCVIIATNDPTHTTADIHFWANKKFYHFHSYYLQNILSAKEVVLALHSNSHKEFSLDLGDRTIKVHREQIKENYIFYLEDRTEMQLLETIRSDFIANLAHELRTPLTSINGALETLKEYGEDLPCDKKQHFLQIAVRHTTRISEIFDNITLLSDIERGRAQLITEEINPTIPIATSIQECLLTAQTKEVKLIKDIQSVQPIRGNDSLITSALTNLILNAIKHSHPKSDIIIRSYSQDNTVKISVQDFGEGIPYEQQERIFERFYRNDVGRDRHKGGSGLGLSLVKHIVKAHGGSIAVQSKAKEGATFIITFPFA